MVQATMIQILTVCLSCDDFELGLASVEYVWEPSDLDIE